jgi:hypothetical protein
MRNGIALRAPEGPDERSAAGGASQAGLELPDPAVKTKANKFIAGLRGGDVTALSSITGLLEGSAEQSKRLVELLGSNQDAAREALRICRGALLAGGEDAELLRSTVERFHIYVFKLKGSIAAHITCMDSLKGSSKFPCPITIFGSPDFQVDTPTRQQLRDRYGDNLDDRLVSASAEESGTSSLRRKSGSLAEPLVIGGSSAQAMSGPVYHLFFPNDPSIPGHLCGWQSNSKLLEAYNITLLAKLEADVAAREQDILDIQKRLGLSEDTPINLEGIEKSTRKSEEKDAPGPDKGPLSKVIAERVALAAALREEIREGLDILDMQRFSDTILTPEGRRFGVGGQSRGHLLTWLSRELSTEEARKGVPEWVVEDFDALRKGGLRKLPLEEVQERLTRLAAFRARRTFVRKECVFSGLTSDLKYLAGLEEQVKAGKATPMTRELLDSIGKAATIVRNVRGVSGESAGEIAKNQVVDVKEACSSLYRFREESCRAALAPVETEFWAAIELFRPLFQGQPGSWKEDCRKPGAPFERLKKTAAGLTLGRHDFAALKEAFELLACAPKENEQAFFRSKNIEDFISMSRGVLSASRKWSMLKQCTANLIQNLSPEEDQARVSSTGVSPVKGLLKSEEAYAESHDGLTPREVVKRAEWLCAQTLHQGGEEAKKLKSRIQKVKEISEAGLYRESQEKDESLAALYQKVKDLVPCGQAEAQIRVIRNIETLRVVTQLTYVRSDQPYLTPKEMATVSALASIANEVITAEENLQEQLSPEQKDALPKLLAAARQGRFDPERKFVSRHASMTFVTGSIESTLGGKQVQMRLVGRFDEAERAEVEKRAPIQLPDPGQPGQAREEAIIRYLPPDALLKSVVRAIHGYQRVDEVFAQQALLLCEASNAEFLRQIGFAPGTREAWDLLKRSRSNSPVSSTQFRSHDRWVRSDLVRVIEEAYSLLEPLLPQDRRAETRKPAPSLHGKTLGELAGVPNAKVLFPIG